jgi:hypothetical protein
MAHTNDCPAPGAEDLAAECARLRERLRQVEQERDAYRRALDEANLDRKELRRFAMEWANREFGATGPQTEEEWRRLIESEKWTPFEEVLKELDLGLARTARVNPSPAPAGWG